MKDAILTILWQSRSPFATHRYHRDWPHNGRALGISGVSHLGNTMVAWKNPIIFIFLFSLSTLSVLAGEFTVGATTVKYIMVTQDEPGLHAYTPHCLTHCYMPIKFNLSNPWTVDMQKLKHTVNMQKTFLAAGSSLKNVQVTFGRWQNVTSPTTVCNDQDHGNGTFQNCSVQQITSEKWKFFTPAQAQGYSAEQDTQYVMMLQTSVGIGDKVDVVPTILDNNLTEYAFFNGTNVEPEKGLVAWYDLNSTNAGTNLATKINNLTLSGNYTYEQGIVDDWLCFNDTTAEGVAQGSLDSWPGAHSSGEMTILWCGKNNRVAAGGRAINLRNASNVRNYMFRDGSQWDIGTGDGVGTNRIDTPWDSSTDDHVCIFSVYENGTAVHTAYRNLTDQESESADQPRFDNGEFYINEQSESQSLFCFDHVMVWNVSHNFTTMQYVLNNLTHLNSPLGIVNVAPTISITLSPASVTTSDDITCQANVSDTDLDTLTLDINWTVDGVETLNTQIAANDSEIHNLTLGEGNYTKDQVLNCTGTVDDGTETATDHASVTVGNTAPTIEDVADQNTRPNQLFELMVGCTDIDETEAVDLLSFTDNATEFVINSTSGLISFTPTVEGTIPVTVTCSDSTAQDSDTFDISVQSYIAQYSTNNLKSIIVDIIGEGGVATIPLMPIVIIFAVFAVGITTTMIIRK